MFWTESESFMVILTYKWGRTESFDIQEGMYWKLIIHKSNLDFYGMARKQPISYVWRWEWHQAEED